MPTIDLTNNTTISISGSSNETSATLNRYLKSILTFKTPPTFDSIANQPIANVKASAFPVTLSAAGSGNFAVEQTTLNVQAGASAALGVLKEDDKSDFLKSLNLPDDPATTALVSFALRGSLSVNDSASVSDFSFGVTKGAHVTFTSYYSAVAADTLGAAVEKAVAGITIPHDLNDLTSLPSGNICQLDASSLLKFCASISYSFLNDPLASVSLQKLPSISINATAGATIDATATHTAGHTITIAKLSDRLLHLAVSLTNTDDLDTNLTVSAGLTADLGSADALAFLLDKISPNSTSEMKIIKQDLPQKAQELSEDIKTCIDGALVSSLQASLKVALDRSESRKRMFVYEIDLQALDGDSKPALEAALAGDFTAMTKRGAQFAGIKELDSALTVTSKITHRLGLHLLGIFNYESTNEFIKTSKVNFTTDRRDIVLSDEAIGVTTDNLADDKLRQIVLKKVTLTLPASANTPASDSSINMVFFDREASTSKSKMRQFVNVLRAIGSSDSTAAGSLLDGKKYGACSLYLGLNLTATQCKRLFIGSDGKPYDWTVYLEKVRDAQTIILANDSDNAKRLKLFSVGDVEIWKQLKDAGTAQAIVAILNRNGFPDSSVANLLVPDVMTAVWWSEAMGNYASALSKGQPLVESGKDLVKDGTLGYSEPWLILASWNILENPAVDSLFTSSLLKSQVAKTAGAAGPSD
jgi:hypothetical protein